MLMAALTVLFVVVGGALGGEQGAVTAFLLAAAMNFFAYFFSDKMVLARYRARQVGPNNEPRLYGIVARLADGAGLPMPKVYVIPDRTPNAFATGRNHRHAAVAATQGILELLDDDELEGVMAHELAHVKHYDILSGTIASTFAGAIALISRSAMYSGQQGSQSRSNPLLALLAVVAAPMIAMIIRMSISRVREFAADDGGAEISRKPLGLASALEKISAAARRPLLHMNSAHAHMFIISPISGRGLSSLMSSHPPMEERVRRLRALAAGTA
jgi:heat shock protein HtpX